MMTIYRFTTILIIFFVLPTLTIGQIFGPEKVISQVSFHEPLAFYSADMDGDTYNDVISLNDTVIVWWKNLGNGAFGVMDTLAMVGTSSYTTTPRKLIAFDVDNDGDNDMVCNVNINHATAFYQQGPGPGPFPPPEYYEGILLLIENLGGANFDAPRLITDSLGYNVALSYADLDEDGDMDLLTGTTFRSDYNGVAHYHLRQPSAVWYENVGGGVFVHHTLLDTLVNTTVIKAADLDKDGDNDIICASNEDDRIVFFENYGSGVFSSKQYATSAASAQLYNRISDIEVKDVTGDSLPDILGAHSITDNLILYKNLGNNTFGMGDTISSTIDAIYGIHVDDVDNDGDMDVVSAAPYTKEIALYKNTGNGTFMPPVILNNTAHIAVDVFVSDITRDSLPDVLSFSHNDNKIAWYKNLGSGQFAGEAIITPEVSGPVCVRAADMDDDGDADVLSYSQWDGRIALFENLGNQVFASSITISTDALGKGQVDIGDVDGDSIPDVLAASGDGTVAWYKNMGGNSFSPQILISDSIYAREIFAVDIDDDGDIDVVTANTANHNGKLVWFENLGSGNFSSEHIITTDQRSMNLAIDDIDGDGLKDILASVFYYYKLVWFKNLGNGLFAPEQVIRSGLSAVRLPMIGNFNNDGKKDVMTVYSSGKVIWFANLGGGTFSSEIYLIDTTNYFTARCHADFDMNGHTEPFFGGQDVQANEFMHFTTPGNGVYNSPYLAQTDEVPQDAFPCDLDGDGDLDLVFVTFEDNKVAWYENLLINIPIGVNENEEEIASIYPNPYTESTNIVFNEPITDKFVLRIIDVTGRLIVSKQLTQGQSRIEVFSAETGKGFFLAYVDNGKTQEFLGKLVVK